MMENVAATRSRLLERLAGLEAQVQQVEESQHEPLTEDWPDQAIEREDDEALDAVERAALNEIAQVRQAITRLDAGLYGICAACGVPIEAKRLEALPTTIHCVACAQETP